MATRKKHTPQPTYTEQIQAVVNGIDFVPDYTELLNEADTMNGMVEAFIADRVDRLDELGSVEDRDRDDTAAWTAIRALCQGQQPAVDLAALGDLLGRWAEHTSTVSWAREEIVYALGVEVGRRLGAAR
jgi:hypothetical protein